MLEFYPGREGSTGACAEQGVETTIVLAPTSMKVTVSVSAPLCTIMRVCLEAAMGMAVDMAIRERWETCHHIG